MVVKKKPWWRSREWKQIFVPTEIKSEKKNKIFTKLSTNTIQITINHPLQPPSFKIMTDPGPSLPIINTAFHLYQAIWCLRRHKWMDHSIKIIGLQAGKRSGKIRGRGRLATMKRCSLIKAPLKILQDRLGSMLRFLRNLDLMSLQDLIKQIKTNLLKLCHKIYVELLSQCQAL